MERHVEKHLDPFDPDFPEDPTPHEGADLVPVGDAETGPADGMLALPVRVEGPKSNAMRRKFL